MLYNRYFFTLNLFIMKTRFLYTIAFLLGLQALLAQPTITGFSPAEERVGATITIRGTGFSGNEEENKVTFGNPDARGEVLSAEAQVLEVQVPANAENGKISVEVNSETAVSTDDFTRLIHTVEDFDPKEFSRYKRITITGTNFAKITEAATSDDPAVHANEVCFNEVCMNYDNHRTIRNDFGVLVLHVTVNDEGTRLRVNLPVRVSPNQLEEAGAYIPKGVGTLKVRIGTQEIEAGQYIFGFSVTGVTPTSARMGETITIMGSQLTEFVNVTIGSRLGTEYLSQIYEISDDQTQAKVRISPNVRGREQDINEIMVSKCVENCGGTPTIERVSLGFTVPVTDPLTITDFSPTSARLGEVITIRGTGFSLYAPHSEIVFGSFATSLATRAHEVNAAGTELKVRVPLSGARDGKITVFFLNASDEEHRTTSTQDFTINKDAPTVTNFSPTSGGPGDEITIEGSGFSTYASSNEVTFAWTPSAAGEYVAADWVNEDGTQLRATIGEDPFITVAGNVVTAALPIAVKIGSSPPGVSDDKFMLQDSPQKPVVTSFTPMEGAPDTEVMITGERFSETAADNIVVFGDATAEAPTAASATSLTVQVPSGARTGPIKVTVDGHTGTSSAIFTVPGTEPVEPPNPSDILSVPGVEGSVRVYPNPASQEVHLTNLPAAAHTYRVYSLAGKVALTGTTRGSATIDVSGLTRGQYVLVLRAEDGSETLRTQLLIMR